MSRKTAEALDDITAPATGHTHLIEANAGTGKTYAIANLFLRFVLEGLRVRELLVVTFTRAATDELRGRIRKRLTEARTLLETGKTEENTDAYFASLPQRHPEGEARKQAMRHLELAILEISEAPIHTIHGFCQQALTDWAFGSGQAFDLEQADDSELTTRALRDWWRRQTYTLDLPERDLLQCVLPNFDRLRKHLAHLLSAKQPELAPSPDPRATETILQALEQLADAWRQEHQEIRALLLDKDTPLNRHSHRIATLKKHLDLLDTCLLGDAIRLPSEDTLNRLSRRNFKFKGKPDAVTLERFDLPALHHTANLLDVLRSQRPRYLSSLLADAADFVRQQVTQAKQRLGKISFDDMIERLHHALHEGESAGQLAKDLARQYPVILVDEFQDTDALQYAIFRRIHQAAEDHTLILIGDPKQAIYAFRGGDIFTYMQASREADRHWSLTTNWRSTPEMIDAINNLFSGNNPFAYKDIPYSDSHTPPDCKARSLIVDGKMYPALRVEDLPPNNNGKSYNKKDGTTRVCESVAGHIAWLLQPGRASLDGRPLQPGDIAILAITNEQGAAVREALHERGVRAVSAGRNSIWETPEAESLRLLLEAALLPRERGLLRQALACDLLALRYEELDALFSDLERWGAWADLLTETGRRWQEHGFMSGFQHLLHGLGEVLAEAAWLDRQSDPERSLTNLLHLAELLQTASREHPGGERLLAWMKAQQKSTQEDEERQLRLESDANLVKILTIHKSKGLQFPVVFLPWLWSGKEPTKATGSVQWHEPEDEGFRHLYAPTGDPQGAILADHERLAEAVRLAYVALTRAESHCHLYLGSAGENAGRSALAWLISDQSHDFAQEPFDLGVENVSPERLRGRKNIEIIDPQTWPDDLRLPVNPIDKGTLERSELSRSIRQNWRIGSFSAMTAGIHQATRAPAASGAERFALRYPAGAQVGSFLHTLLERLDPAQPLRPQIEDMARWIFAAHGIPDDPVARDLDGLANWMEAVLHTPLDGDKLTLANLSPSGVLRELEFDLGAGLIEASRIDELLAGDGNRPPLDFRAFQGMLNGIIDLVFEYQGRYYIADYKSNLLGRHLEDYRPERLRAEIDARRYDLQYLLYLLALHRHLKSRLRDYDYDTHMGGAWYLFLRAMTPETGPRYGVFFERPPRNLIERLDHDVIGQPGETAA